MKLRISLCKFTKLSVHGEDDKTNLFPMYRNRKTRIQCLEKSKQQQLDQPNIVVSKQHGCHDKNMSNTFTLQSQTLSFGLKHLQT